MSNRRKKANGFSLLEVLIALTVMMGSIMVVAMAWSGSQLRIKKLRLNNQAAFLLDYKMAQTMREYRDQFTLIPEKDQGTFEELGKEYNNFSWSLQSKKFEMPDLSGLLMQGQAPGKGADELMMMLMSQMTDFFSDAAKEISITVVFTFGKNKVQYSANTFIIDFNKQLPLPAMGGGGGLGGPGGNTGGGNTGGGTTGGGNTGGGGGLNP